MDNANADELPVEGINEEPRHKWNLRQLCGRNFSDQEEFKFSMNKCGLALNSIFGMVFMVEMQKKTTEIDELSLKKMMNFWDIRNRRFKDMSHAMELTELYILIRMDESNALETFALGHLHNSDKIKLAAFEVIKKEFPSEMKESKMEQFTSEQLKEIVDTLREMQEVQAEIERN
jgi:hypothetical protein